MTFTSTIRKENMLEEYFPEFLVERPADQRFWVVRASGGTFVRHFRNSGLVAIGHVNDLTIAKGPIPDGFVKKLAAALRVAKPDRTTLSISSHVNQVKTFCHEIKENDLIVTVDSQNLMIGRVSGDAYIDDTAVVITDVYGKQDAMEHNLRRPISWGPILSRKSVPTALEMTLLAHQTVFSLDRHWDAVYHLIYPCFVFEGRLYLSANIKQTESLDNYSITQFFALLSGVESVAKNLQYEKDDVNEYLPSVSSLRHGGDLNLTSKAAFMSPGTIWSSVLLDAPQLVTAVVIYIMLFGGDLKFFKTDGILDIQTRRKMWDRVMKLKKSHDFDHVKEKLKVEIPNYDTTAIETPSETLKRKKRGKGKVVLGE